MSALTVKRVIVGQATVASGDASGTASISPAIKTAQSIVVFRPGASATWSPERHFFKDTLNDIGNGESDTLTFTRAGTPAVAVTIDYYIIEFEAGVTVTRYDYSTGSSWAGSYDKTITAVTLSRSLAIASYNCSHATTGTTTHYLGRFELTSTTNLRLTSKDSTVALDCNVQVVEFDSDAGVTVQQVTQTLSSVTTDDATITAVDLGNTLIFGSSETTSTSANDVNTCGYTALTSTTNLRATRRGANANYVVTSFVVDFGGGAAQAGYQEQSAYSGATLTETITSVNTANTTVQIGGGPWHFGQVGATSSNWQYRLFRPALTDATTITATRDSTASSVVGMPWQVMDWSALMASGGGAAKLIGGKLAGSGILQGRLAA